MKKVDKRGYLDSNPFDYREGKDGKVFLTWEGNQVKILKGKEAEKFLSKVEAANDKEAQLIMAKLTGNFKRGNERASKQRYD